MSTNIQDYSFGYKEKEATSKARKFAFDLCEKAGNLCALTFALTNDVKQTPDWYETQLSSLVTRMYVTLAQCSELLNLNIIDGVKEKMKLNAKKYNEEQCKVSIQISMQHIEKKTHLFPLFYMYSYIESRTYREIRFGYYRQWHFSG